MRSIDVKTPKVAAGRDERHHDELGRPERWWFDLVDTAKGVAVTTEVVTERTRSAASYRLHVFSEAGVCVVRESGVPTPRRRRDLDLRGDALWCSYVCETALEHWTLGAEAFGVSVVTASELFGGERGARVPVGLDIEFEADGPAVGTSTTFAQPGRWHGDVLLGSDVVAVSCRGMRGRDWSDGPVALPHLGATVGEHAAVHRRGGSVLIWENTDARGGSSVPEVHTIESVPAGDDTIRALCRIACEIGEGTGFGEFNLTDTGDSDRDTDT